MGETDAPDSYRLRYNKHLEEVTRHLDLIGAADKSDVERVRELLTLTKGFVHIASHSSIQPNELAEAQRLHRLVRGAADRITGKKVRRLSGQEIEAGQPAKSFQSHESVPSELRHARQPRTVSGGLPSLGGRK